MIQGCVVDTAAGGGSACLVRGDIGGVILSARITRLSADRLALKNGQEVYALIKAVSLHG